MSESPPLIDAISDTLRRAGLPLAGRRRLSDGAVVTGRAHGATVSWRGAPEAPTGDRAGATVVRTHAGPAARSASFRSTLRIAAVLAEAGYHCEHTGDRVLISDTH
jgi:hypothetical protein